MLLMRYSVLAKWSKLLFPWRAVELVCTWPHYFMILCGQNYTGISFSLLPINHPIIQVQSRFFCVMRSHKHTHANTQLYTHTHTHHKSSQHVYGSTWINRQPASGRQESILRHILRTQDKNKAAPWYTGSYTQTYTLACTYSTMQTDTHTHRANTLLP